MDEFNISVPNYRYDELVSLESRVKLLINYISECNFSINAEKINMLKIINTCESRMMIATLKEKQNASVVKDICFADLLSDD